jgi:hypothetical protein
LITGSGFALVVTAVAIAASEATGAVFGLVLAGEFKPSIDVAAPERAG